MKTPYYIIAEDGVREYYGLPLEFDQMPKEHQPREGDRWVSVGLNIQESTGSKWKRVWEFLVAITNWKEMK